MTIAIVGVGLTLAGLIWRVTTWWIGRRTKIRVTAFPVELQRRGTILRGTVAQPNAVCFAVVNDSDHDVTIESVGALERRTNHRYGLSLPGQFPSRVGPRGRIVAF